MTREQLVEAIGEYRAGLEAELTLIRQLADLAARQREITGSGDLVAFDRVADARDRIMRSLLTIEEDLRIVRETLASQRAAASRVPGFDALTELHREASRLVGRILSTDRESIAVLADAELARRSALASLEQGETTLAAYRRVLAPPVATASLVDRRG
jgi:hypothetical protein